MKESVLRLIEVCELCGVSYIPQNGEICDCPEPEEPVVLDWESHPQMHKTVDGDDED